LGNHDRPRVASRVGAAQARVAAMLLLTLRGTPTMYYGDEIGMHQVAIAPDKVRDPFEKNVPGLGVGRDGCRTPMQWDASANGGFTTGAPWLPLPEDAVHENVASLAIDSLSILHLYRALIELRKTTPQLVAGGYVPVMTTGNLLAYRREHGGEVLLIVLNLASDPISIASDAMVFAGEIVLSTNLDRTGETVSKTLALRGDEGLIVRLS
jgi:alpha-glucosidase